MMQWTRTDDGHETTMERHFIALMQYGALYYVAAVGIGGAPSYAAPTGHTDLEGAQRFVESRYDAGDPCVGFSAGTDAASEVEPCDGCPRCAVTGCCAGADYDSPYMLCHTHWDGWFKGTFKLVGNVPGCDPSIDDFKTTTRTGSKTPR